MNRIVLPPLDWFGFGNVFTGSLRGDPERGCLCQTVLEYTVRLWKRQLVASCRFVLPWNEAAQTDEMVLGRFPFSAFGVEVCANWIWSQCFLSAQPLLEQCTQNGA